MHFSDEVEREALKCSYLFKIVIVENVQIKNKFNVAIKIIIIMGR